MLKQFMPEASKRERIEALETLSHKARKTTYDRPLTEDELIAKREQLTEIMVERDIKETELDNIKQTYKRLIDPLKAKTGELLQQVRTKSVEEEGTIYELADHKTEMMETYDEDGFLINSRRLRPDEKNGNLFAIGKAANDE